MPLRIAFLGIDHPHGAHWRQLLQSFGSDIEITAIVPSFGGGLTSLEEGLAAVPRYDSVELLLAGAANHFDGAVVCLSNADSPAALVQLAKAGKHLLVEKPCAGSVADFRPAHDAIRSSGVVFQNGYMWRYDEAACRLQQMVGEKRFGKLISVEMTYVTSDVNRRGPRHYLFDPAASGGGFFNWLACHYLDLLLFITGESVVAVTARVGQFGSVSVGVEDGGTAIMELSGGGIATLTGGYWLPRWAGENRLCLRGDQRWVHWHPMHPGTSGLLEIHGPQPQWHAMEESFSLPEDKTPGYGGKRGVGLVKDWLDTIRTGGRTCRSTITSTQATLQLLDKIYESSREGKRINCEIGGS